MCWRFGGVLSHFILQEVGIGTLGGSASSSESDCAAWLEEAFLRGRPGRFLDGSEYIERCLSFVRCGSRSFLHLWSGRCVYGLECCLDLRASFVAMWTLGGVGCRDELVAA